MKLLDVTQVSLQLVSFAVRSYWVLFCKNYTEIRKPYQVIEWTVLVHIQTAIWKLHFVQPSCCARPPARTHAHTHTHTHIYNKILADTSVWNFLRYRARFIASRVIYLNVTVFYLIFSRRKLAAVRGRAYNFVLWMVATMWVALALVC